MVSSWKCRYISKPKCLVSNHAVHQTFVYCILFHSPQVFFFLACVCVFFFLFCFNPVPVCSWRTQGRGCFVVTNGSEWFMGNQSCKMLLHATSFCIPLSCKLSTASVSWWIISQTCTLMTTALQYKRACWMFTPTHCHSHRCADDSFVQNYIRSLCQKRTKEKWEKGWKKNDSLGGYNQWEAIEWQMGTWLAISESNLVTCK